MNCSFRKMRRCSYCRGSTFPRPQILPWLHVFLQPVKARSIAFTVAFSEQMCQVASTGIDHFIPGLAVDHSTSGSTGHLVLAFYYYANGNCSSSTCRLDVGSSSSTDGGNSWSSTKHLAGPMTLSWLASTSQGSMVGDYISTSFCGGKAYPVFAVAMAPRGGVFNEAMFTVLGGLW
jgi:hypothetical protein